MIYNVDGLEYKIGRFNFVLVKINNAWIRSSKTIAEIMNPKNKHNPKEVYNLIQPRTCVPCDALNGDKCVLGIQQDVDHNRLRYPIRPTGKCYKPRSKSAYEYAEKMIAKN